MADPYPLPGNWQEFPWFHWTVEPRDSRNWIVTLFPSIQASTIEYLNGKFVLDNLLIQVGPDVQADAGLIQEPYYRVVGVRAVAAGVETLAFTRFKPWWDAAGADDWLTTPRDPTAFRVATSVRWKEEAQRQVNRDSRVHQDRMPLDWVDQAYDDLRVNNPQAVVFVIEGGGIITRRRVVREQVRRLFPDAVDKE